VQQADDAHLLRWADRVFVMCEREDAHLTQLRLRFPGMARDAVDLDVADRWPRGHPELIQKLLRKLARHPLPGWAAEIDCSHWAQVALKFAVSHPAVTCAIPATSQVVHLRQNMAAARGPMPDAALRARMARDVAAL